MLSIRPLRRFARSIYAADTQPFAPSSRRDVCPPALLPEAAHTGLRRWLRRWSAAKPADPQQRVVAVREEFARTLDGIDTQHAQFLQHTIRHKGSLRELWHLRAEMFVLIAQSFTEHEAEQRMATLARHFPVRVSF